MSQSQDPVEKSASGAQSLHRNLVSLDAVPALLSRSQTSLEEFFSLSGYSLSWVTSVALVDFPVARLEPVKFLLYVSYTNLSCVSIQASEFLLQASFLYSLILPCNTIVLSLIAPSLEKKNGGRVHCK